MQGSGKIQVIKRDGFEQPFEMPKLAASMWRAMRLSDGGRYSDARDLAVAIAIYLSRDRRPHVGSAEIFKMALKVLRRARLTDAAWMLEQVAALRSCRRRRARIVHPSGAMTVLEKGWLVELARQSWNLSETVARIIAGQAEMQLLLSGKFRISRDEAVELLNRRVAEYGLADAVPLRLDTVGG